MTTPKVMRIMALSINTAIRAGSIIREVMHRGNLGIVEKEVLALHIHIKIHDRYIY